MKQFVTKILSSHNANVRVYLLLFYLIFGMAGCSTGRLRPEPQPHDGNWALFYDNGQKQVEGSFSSRQRSGKWTWFDRDGLVLEQGEYEAGRKIGEWRYWPQVNRTFPASESGDFQTSDSIYGVAFNANGGDTYPARVGLSFHLDVRQRWRVFTGYGLGSVAARSFSSGPKVTTFGAKYFPFNFARNNGVTIRSVLGWTMSLLNEEATSYYKLSDGRSSLSLADFGAEIVPPADAVHGMNHMIIGLGVIVPLHKGLSIAGYARISAIVW